MTAIALARDDDGAQVRVANFVPAPRGDVNGYFVTFGGGGTAGFIITECKLSKRLI
jgi:hypothetical protein